MYAKPFPNINKATRPSIILATVFMVDDFSSFDVASDIRDAALRCAERCFFYAARPGQWQAGSVKQRQPIRLGDWGRMALAKSRVGEPGGAGGDSRGRPRIESGPVRRRILMSTTRSYPTETRMRRGRAIVKVSSRRAMLAWTGSLPSATVTLPIIARGSCRALLIPCESPGFACQNGRIWNSDRPQSLLLPMSARARQTLPNRVN